MIHVKVCHLAFAAVALLALAVSVRAKPTPTLVACIILTGLAMIRLATIGLVTVWLFVIWFLMIYLAIIRLVTIWFLCDRPASPLGNTLIEILVLHAQNKQEKSRDSSLCGFAI